MTVYALIAATVLASSPSASTPDPLHLARVYVLEHRGMVEDGELRIVGRVRNRSGEWVTARLAIELTGKDGQRLHVGNPGTAEEPSDHTYPAIDPLAPGRVAPFVYRVRLDRLSGPFQSYAVNVTTEVFRVEEPITVIDVEALERDAEQRVLRFAGRFRNVGPEHCPRPTVVYALHDHEGRLVDVRRQTLVDASTGLAPDQSLDFEQRFDPTNEQGGYFGVQALPDCDRLRSGYPKSRSEGH